MLHASRSGSESYFPGEKRRNKEKPVVGIEPTTRALRMRCSTTELHRRHLGVKVIARMRRRVKR
jgi:hypothetical protein